EPVERRVADRLVDALDLDRPFAVLRVRITGLLDRALDPVPCVVPGELGPVLEQVGGRGRGVEPAVHGCRVLRKEVPQGDSPSHQGSLACSRSAACLSGESGEEPAYGSTAAPPTPPSRALGVRARIFRSSRRERCSTYQ